MEVTHRQRKKAETRAAIIRSSFVLFSERGYDRTTVADIATHANYAPRTFFLYFKSKEELLPAFMEQLSEDLAERLTSRNAQTSTVRVLREWMSEMVALHPVPSASPTVAHHDASFEGRKHFYLTAFVGPVLATAFARDLDVEADAMGPKLVATQAAALLDAFDFAQDTSQREHYVDTAMQLLDSNMRLLLLHH